MNSSSADAPEPTHTGPHPARWRQEHGFTRGSWAVQLVVILTVVGVLAYDGVAIGVANTSVDRAAGEVAQTARDAYRSERSLEQATQAAETAAEARDTTLTALTEDGTDVIVTLEKRAATLVLHRLPPTRDLTSATATRRAGLASTSP